MNAHDLIISDHRDNTWDPGPLVKVKTKPGLFLTDISPNGHLVARSNPISWLVDLGQCIPFLNFNGSGSQASQDAAQALANQQVDPNASSAPDPGLGVFANTFGLAPSTVPGQAGSVGTPSDSSSGLTPLQSAQQDVNAFTSSWTAQQAAAAARPNTATPVAGTSSAAAKPAAGGPFVYIKRVLGGK